MRLVAVLDTNVLLSGVGWKGKPYQCLELARAGAIDAFTCPEILDELTEKLRTRLHFTPDRINATLTELLSVLTVVRIANQLHGVSTDPDDDKILECAVVASATHIVTGDRKHLLPLNHYRNMPIVSPAEFLQLATAATTGP